MKQFLRYQISGTTFMFWLAIFGIGGRTNEFHELAKTLYEDAENLKILAGIAAALPIGVLIHQFSVLIKNWVIGKCFKDFSDFPTISCYQKELELNQYCLDRISNLNSFYYVRFDNGLLAPMFAWFVVAVLIGIQVKAYLLMTAGFIALLTLAYIPRIYCEMRFYRDIVKKINVEPSGE